MSGDVRIRPPVAWGPDVQLRKLNWIPVLYPKAGQTVAAISLSVRPEVALVHYTAERGRPCTGQYETCHWCQTTPYRPRSYLYVAGWSPDSGRYMVLQITKHAAVRCRPLIDNAVSLRGKKITLKRPGQHAEGAVFATVEDFRLKGELPQPFNVREAMEVVWFGDIVAGDDGKDGVQ